ncbi:MAG: ComF family protein [Candidatus Omnitrophota bacterium]
MFRALLNSLADIIYPRICLACKHKLDNAHIDNLICKKCWSSINKNLPPFCHSCGRRLKKENFTKNICPACVKINLHFDRAFSPCIYDGAVKKLIHVFKYARKDYLGEPLSKLMIGFIKEYNLPIKYMDYIVPVPLHAIKLREREFNQADILSKHIAEEFNKEILKNNLIRHKFTKTQAELKADERILNIRGSFSVIKPEGVKGKNLLLVDDVLTTGATASEAALTLKQAGANIVFVLTVAN